ncbi:MAG: DNA-directed RNA polymerase subunit alpha C-terminal domain-containing protein [Planctomycetota bacterium]
MNANTLSLNSLNENTSLDTLQSMRREAFAHVGARSQFRSDYISFSGSNLIKGYAAWILGLTDKVLAHLKDSTTGLSLYLQGSACLESNRYAQAHALLSKAQSSGAPQPACDADLIEAAILIGQNPEPMLSKSRLTVADKEYLQGLYAEATGRSEAALNHHLAAISANPHHRKALFKAGLISEKFGNESAAVGYYEKCREELPVLECCLVNLAILYEDKGRYQEAIWCLEEVLEADPTQRRARMLLKSVNDSMNMTYDEEAERESYRQSKFLETKISDFELSVRSRNCLQKMNIHTLGQLVSMSENELLSYPNFGETSLDEIKKILTTRGLRLGMNQKLASESQSAASESQDPRHHITISELKLTVRSSKVLESLGIRNVGELVQFTEEQLLAQKNFGKTSIKEISSKLAEQGLSLSMGATRREATETAG